MKVICGIYLYRDLKEDKIIYVGQSVNIYNRHRQHLRPSSYDDQPINRVLQNDPLRYILEIERRCSKEELNDLEEMYIDTLNPPFNFIPGGSYTPVKQSNSKYTLWSSKKVHYVSHVNQSRNRPFRLYYNGWYVPCGYFETWFDAELVWNIIKMEDKE